ncbi:MAG: hypothetical protein NC336_10360 [Clostridium sp.]|nr:hypothetical protein [Clostridium sp.]
MTKAEIIRERILDATKGGAEIAFIVYPKNQYGVGESYTYAELTQEECIAFLSNQIDCPEAFDGFDLNKFSVSRIEDQLSESAMEVCYPDGYLHSILYFEFPEPLNSVIDEIVDEGVITEELHSKLQEAFDEFQKNPITTATVEVDNYDSIQEHEYRLTLTPEILRKAVLAQLYDDAGIESLSADPDADESDDIDMYEITQALNDQLDRIDNEDSGSDFWWSDVEDTVREHFDELIHELEDIMNEE